MQLDDVPDRQQNAAPHMTHEYTISHRCCRRDLSTMSEATAAISRRIASGILASIDDTRRDEISSLVSAMGTLEDSNGDGRADIKRQMLTGFALSNPHLIAFIKGG